MPRSGRGDRLRGRLRREVPKAVTKITDGIDELLAFYNVPAKHWQHLGTTNPIWVLDWLGRAGCGFPVRCLRRSVLTLNAMDAGRLSWIRTLGRAACAQARGVWLEESLHDSTQICRHRRVCAYHGSPRRQERVLAQQGVAGIDPHKHTATLTVLDHRGGVLDSRSLTISSDRITELLTFLLDTEVSFDRIDVEGSGFLGRPLVLALSAAGYDVREVQANRTANRRKRPRRAKTEAEDAETIARETLADSHLPPAGKHDRPSPAWQTLTALRDWRESLVLPCVRLLTEAEAVLVTLPGAVRNALPSTSRVLPQLTTLRDEDVITATAELGPADRVKLDRLAASLTDITTLTDRISTLDKQIPPVLDELGCSLTALSGIGVVTAMELLAEVGDPLRFHTETQFARWCGAAPAALSSGEGHSRPHRHRLDLGGNRAVNSILHPIHLTQIRCHKPAQTYVAGKIGERKSKRDARRCHKRHLANVITRHMWHDARRARTAHSSLPDPA